MPAAPPHDQPADAARDASPTTAPWRPVVIASVTSAVLVLVAATAMLGQAWYGFRRFGSGDLAARAVGLEIVRAWGAWGAAVAASLHVTAMHHGGLAIARRRVRFAVLAAVAVPMLYGPVCALALAAAMAEARAVLGLRPASFFAMLEADDLLHGLLAATALGCVPAAWSLLGARSSRSQARGLASKLFATWLVMLGVSFAGAAARGCVGGCGAEVGHEGAGDEG